MGDIDKRTKRTLCIALPLIALLCVGLTYFQHSYMLVKENYTIFNAVEPGVWDLTSTEGNIWRIGGEMAYIPALVTPEEFAARESEMQVGDPGDSNVATMRARVLLPEGTYTIAVSSVDYASRIYINGELRQEAGTPTETAEGFVPAYAYFDLDVRPEDGAVEVVLQGANFVHRDNGGYNFTMGPADVMDRRIGIGFGIPALMMGLFLCMLVVHLALYFILRGYKANLWFALFCLAWFFRVGLTGVKLLWAWFPDAPWELFFRMEYLTQPVACVCVIFLLRELLPGLLPRWFVRAIVASSAAYALLCAFLPTLPLSWAILGYEAVIVFAIAVIAVCLARWLPGRARRREVRVEQWITLAGLFVFVPITVYDVLYFNDFIRLPGGSSLSDVGVLIFAFFMIVAVFYGTMHEVTKAREAERRAQMEADMLSEMSRLKNQFYTDLSHEMKTPLTVISGNAQFAAKRVRAGAADAEDAAREDIAADMDAVSAEARRLAQMVAGLVGLGRMQGSTERAPLALGSLLTETVRIYGSLSARKRNVLSVEVESDLPAVKANADQIVQVLINLLSNANRHTGAGTVSVRAETLDGMVRVTVADDGEGIAPDMLPHVFERLQRGEGGDSGLGLTICKAIVEEHGGEIGIESEQDAGTTVWFTMPVDNEVRTEGSGA